MIQTHNLPLKSRMRETGWAIKGTLVEVLEVDVADTVVQGGKYMRVKVHVDVTKRLVRGKKVAIKGDMGRWVHFKYEHLPNFCYNYGLLSHDLRDCLKLFGNGKTPDLNGL